MLPSSEAAGVGLLTPDTESLAANDEPVKVPPLSVTLTVGVALVMRKVVVEVALFVIRRAGKIGHHRVGAGVVGAPARLAPPDVDPR